MMYNILSSLNNLSPPEIGMIVRKVKIFTDGFCKSPNFKLTLFIPSVLQHHQTSLAYLSPSRHSVFPHFRFLTNQCKWQMNIFCAHKYFIGKICAAAGSKTSRRARSELTEIDSRMFGAEEVTFTSARCTRAGNELSRGFKNHREGP